MPISVMLLHMNLTVYIHYTIHTGHIFSRKLKSESYSGFK